MNPDWTEALDGVVTPPIIGKRRVVPLFPKIVNEEGHLEVPDTSELYTSSAVHTLLTTFSIDTEARALDTLQRADAVEACRLLVSAIELGDDVFDNPIPVLPFRCLDEAHAMQYLTSGRPCMLLAQPICEGLYKLRNNKTGTSNKNLMRSLVGSAVNAYVPVDMLRYDQNLREQDPGEVPCHAVYMVTVTYDRAHDVPETFKNGMVPLRWNH